MNAGRDFGPRALWPYIRLSMGGPRTPCTGSSTHPEAVQGEVPTSEREESPRGGYSPSLRKEIWV